MGGIIALLLLLCNRSFAEGPGTNPSPLERPTLPAPMETPPPVSVSPELPPLPEVPKDNNRLSAVERVFVKQFVFEGNTVFSTEELRDAIKISEYEGKAITAEQLQEVKNKVTRYYISKDYINSGAIIPDQTVVEGMIKLRIIEGKLTIPIKVEKAGDRNWLSPYYVRKRLEYGETEVLNVKDLQERLQILQQNPLFKRINAELGPGAELGKGELRIDVEEANPWSLDFRFNNHRSPSVGAYRGEVEARNINLIGLGDTLYGRYGITRGLDDYTVNYSLPILHHYRYETTLILHAERSDSKVISEPFNQLDVKSKADTYALGINQSLYKTANKELDIGLRLEKRKSETFLLGRPFSFSPGVRDGKSNITVLRFSQDWLDRDRNQVIAARSSFNFGLKALGSTINQDGSPDSKFFSWLGQFQWVRRLEKVWDSQVLLRTDLQWANHELLPLEKISVGGATTVRGYRENQLTRDNGLIASLEWRIPLFKLQVPGLIKDPEEGWLQLAPFVDYGRAWNAKGDTPDPKDISSAGLGLRWSPVQYVHAEMYWGHPFRKIPKPQDKDLQDDGLHFEINVNFTF